MPDDNDDLDFGDPRPVAKERPVTAIVDGIIPEDERNVPARVDPALHDVPLAPYVFVRAHHNLPAWRNIDGGFLEAIARNRKGEVINDRASMGFIPNHEEGVRAVELGFAELIETPKGVEPPEEW